MNKPFAIGTEIVILDGSVHIDLIPGHHAIWPMPYKQSISLDIGTPVWVMKIRKIRHVVVRITYQHVIVKEIEVGNILNPTKFIVDNGTDVWAVESRIFGSQRPFVKIDTDMIRGIGTQHPNFLIEPE